MGSNPTPDSTLIYLPMDRKLRRELSKRKWISRAKKVYNSCGIPVNGIKASVHVPIFRNRALRICESITDFLNDSKYAKMLKNCTSPYRSKMTNIRKRIEKIDIRLRKISRKVFRNMSPGTIFHAHHSMMEVYARKDY